MICHLTNYSERGVKLEELKSEYPSKSGTVHLVNLYNYNLEQRQQRSFTD